MGLVRLMQTIEALLPFVQLCVFIFGWTAGSISILVLAKVTQ